MATSIDLLTIEDWTTIFHALSDFAHAHRQKGFHGVAENTKQLMHLVDTIISEKEEGKST